MKKEAKNTVKPFEISLEEIEQEVKRTGQKLIKLRTDKGLTRGEAARQMDINLSQLIKDENAFNNTTLHRLIKYAKFYGVEILSI